MKVERCRCGENAKDGYGYDRVDEFLLRVSGSRAIMIQQPLWHLYPWNRIWRRRNIFVGRANEIPRIGHLHYRCRQAMFYTASEAVSRPELCCSLWLSSPLHSLNISFHSLFNPQSRPNVHCPCLPNDLFPNHNARK